eukprot:jgi/Ulvmu1/8027/UM004_0264.1
MPIRQLINFNAIYGRLYRRCVSRAPDISLQHCLRPPSSAHSSKQLQSDSGDPTLDWTEACVTQYKKFLTLQPCPLRSDDPGAEPHPASQELGLAGLAKCLPAYTVQQHTVILSRLSQARSSSYEHITSVAESHDGRVVVQAYIHMLARSTLPEINTSSLLRLPASLRQSAELLQPQNVVCWPWPARACSSSHFPPGKEETAAAAALYRVLQKDLTARLSRNKQTSIDWKSVTDSMHGVALVIPHLHGSSGQLIARCVSSMIDASSHSQDGLSHHDHCLALGDPAASSKYAQPTASDDLQGPHRRSNEPERMALKKQRATDTMLHVFDAMEALHVCPSPSKPRLAAQLLCSAARPLDMATRACLHSVSVSSLTSALCSLALHFSARQHVIAAFLSGHTPPQYAQRSAAKSPQQSKSSRTVFASSCYRSARSLSEKYLGRILLEWSARVAKGQMSLPDLCAGMVALTAAQHAASPVAPQRGPQAVIARRYPHMCSAMISDVQRRFQDSADRTVFHAWEYAAIVGCAAAAPDPDVAFLEQTAAVIAEDMEWAPDTWSMRNLAAVLVPMATHGIPGHRLFTAATLVSLQRLREAEAAPAHAVVALGHAEGLVWAFAVSRRAYPYSADAVCTAAASMLEQVLRAVPESASIAVVAQMLWSFAAMWKTPPGLFLAADAALVGREREVDFETAMSLDWAFGRAGMRVPAAVESRLAPVGTARP